jgi:hypothetical protein
MWNFTTKEKQIKKQQKINNSKSNKYEISEKETQIKSPKPISNPFTLDSTNYLTWHSRHNRFDWG